MSKLVKIQKHYPALNLHKISGREVTLDKLCELFDDDLYALFCRYLPDGYRFFDAPELAESLRFEEAAAELKNIIKNVRLNPCADLVKTG